MQRNQPITIIEIIHKAKQGLSEPYLCEGNDGNRYWVKGRQSCWPSTQVKEWIAAHLAKAFGLPVPDFRLVEVTNALLAVSVPEFRRLGECVAFGSREVRFATWFETANIKNIDTTLQKDLLVFDWWLRNDDRRTENMNLLWDNSSVQPLVVIDHNLTFDQEFDPASFLKDHPFGFQWNLIYMDMVARLAYQDRLKAVLPAFNQAVNSIPPSWAWLDKEETIPTNVDLAYYRGLLERCLTDDFWRAE